MALELGWLLNSWRTRAEPSGAPSRTKVRVKVIHAFADPTTEKFEDWARVSGGFDSVSTMDAVQVQQKLELSADEDFILTAWQYRMMQRDVAVSTSKYLRVKRGDRNAFRTSVVEALAQRSDDDWSPAVFEFVCRVIPPRGGPDLEALEDAGPEIFSAIATRSRALLLLIDLYGFEPWAEP